MADKQPAILLTTDGSPDSLAAVGPTTALAERLGARVILLTVVCEGTPPSAPPALLPATVGAWNRRLEAEVVAARQRLEQLAEGIRARLGGTDRVEVVVVRAECVEAVIASLAAVRGAQFIAMASHGRSGVKRLLLGSVTEEVIRRASTPVIVFPIAA